MSKSILAFVACLICEASAGGASVLSAAISSPLAQIAYEQLPKDLLEKAGFPTPKSLVCDALNSTKLQDHFKHLVCEPVPKEYGEACQAAVAFSWKQEEAEEKCPGAGEVWWPFHLLHKMANKLICYELTKGNGDFHKKEQEISVEVCNELSHETLKHWACMEAMKELWNHWEKDCKSMAPARVEDFLPENELPENQDFHV